MTLLFVIIIKLFTVKETNKCYKENEHYSLK